MMLMDLQATATHLAIAVESLSCVELFRRALCISCVLSQQVVPETLCTPVVTETLKANDFVLCSVERTIWQGFEVQLVIENTFFFIHLFSRSLVSAAIHNVTAASFTVT